MYNVIKELEDKNWFENSNRISTDIKKELQGNNTESLIKQYRLHYEPKRIAKIDELKRKIIMESSVENLDEKINEFTSKIKEINENINKGIKFNLLEYIYKNRNKFNKSCPVSVQISEIMYEDNHLPPNIIVRSHSIFNTIVVSSTSQSAKSNAGNAGELFVDVLLRVAGLKEGETYKSQHKSESGSDTDFVIPYVEDMKDQDVDIFIAVQFSTNDRLRMTLSELKPGANHYVVIGNGLDASSKDLKDVGEEILNSMEEKNVRLVCFNSKRIEFLKSLDKSNSDKYKYFKDYSIGFSDFANKLRKQYCN